MGIGLAIGSAVRVPFLRRRGDASRFVWMKSPFRLYMALLVVVGLAFVFVYFLAYPRSLDSRPIFTSPKVNADYIVTERWQDGFSYPLPRQDQLSEPLALALTPRDAAALDGSVVPKAFGGTILFFGVLQAIGNPLVLLAVPILAVLAAAALSLITYELFGVRAAGLSYLLWLAFPPFWVNTSRDVSPDIPALMLLLVGVYLSLKYWKQGGDRWLVGASLFFSLAVAFRYPYVLIVPPLLVALFALRPPRAVAALKAASVAVAVGAVLLAFNKAVYDSFFTTGYSLSSDLVDSTVNVSSRSLFFAFDPGLFLDHIRIYFTSPMLFLPLYAGAAALLFLLPGEHDRRTKALALCGLGISITLLVFNGGRQSWGVQAFFLNAAFLRYSLPAMALWIPFCAGFTSRLAKRHSLPVLMVVTAVLGANIFVTLTSAGGVLDFYQIESRLGQIKQEVVSATEENALIVTRLMDKALFPERQTVTATYLVHNERPVPRDRLIYEFVPEPEQLADAIAGLAEVSVPLYILNDGVIEDVSDIDEPLLAAGYRLQKVPDVESAELFRVVAASTQDGEGTPHGDDR